MVGSLLKYMLFCLNPVNILKNKQNTHTHTHTKSISHWKAEHSFCQLGKHLEGHSGLYWVKAPHKAKNW